MNIKIKIDFLFICYFSLIISNLNSYFFYIIIYAFFLFPNKLKNRNKIVSFFLKFQFKLYFFYKKKNFYINY
jgi:hypothetical protein